MFVGCLAGQHDVHIGTVILGRTIRNDFRDQEHSKSLQYLCQHQVLSESVGRRLLQKVLW